VACSAHSASTLSTDPSGISRIRRRYGPPQVEESLAAKTNRCRRIEHFRKGLLKPAGHRNHQHLQAVNTAKFFQAGSTPFKSVMVSSLHGKSIVQWSAGPTISARSFGRAAAAGRPARGQIPPRFHIMGKPGRGKILPARATCWCFGWSVRKR
jgi:hypothetical protein